MKVIVALFVAAVSAHDIDLNRPPLMDVTVNVLPEGSNDLNGYRETTAGWKMSNNYKITATDMTVTQTVSFRGDFESGQIIAPYIQWQDWEAPWQNSVEEEQAEFMNFVCNMFVGPDIKVAKTEMEMTCGTNVFEEMWKEPFKGYTHVKGNMFKGYPASDSERCQAVDFDFKNGVKQTSKSGQWSKAVC